MGMDTSQDGSPGDGFYMETDCNRLPDRKTGFRGCGSTAHGCGLPECRDPIQ